MRNPQYISAFGFWSLKYRFNPVCIRIRIAIPSYYMMVNERIFSFQRLAVSTRFFIFVCLFRVQPAAVWTEPEINNVFQIILTYTSNSKPKIRKVNTKFKPVYLISIL